MKILLATNNHYKQKEYQKMFEGLNIEIITLHDLKSNEEAPENKTTFECNALQKANYYFDLFKMPIICDDSGLEVKNLNGFPGVNSKRWLDANYAEKIKKLLKMLKDKKPTCNMTTVIAYKDKRQELTFRGELQGVLKQPLKIPQGAFGYDIGFFIPNHNKMLYEIPKFKAKYSHRTKALQKFIKWYRSTK